MKITILDECIGCGDCVSICPEGVLEIEDEKSVVVNLDACTACKACTVSCEYDAIIVEE